MKGLTPKQRTVLALIVEHWQNHGRSPSVRELMPAIGVASTCTVQRHLDALEKKGFVKRDRYQRCSVKPTGFHIPDHGEMRRLLADAEAALAPFARGADTVEWTRGEPLPDSDWELTFLDFSRAANALAAIRAALGGAA